MRPIIELSDFKLMGSSPDSTGVQIAARLGIHSRYVHDLDDHIQEILSLPNLVFVFRRGDGWVPLRIAQAVQERLRRRAE